MKYPLEFLARRDLLLDARVVPLASDARRGLHIGIFGKMHFENLADFARFTANISSLTQAWYTGAGIDRAYDDYHPDESDKIYHHRTAPPCALVDWLGDLGIDVDRSAIPPDLAGPMLWFGDADEFGLVGEGDRCYFEAYIADRI